MARLPEPHPWIAAAACVAALTLALPAEGGAQVSERPGTTADHPYDVAWDVTGRSVKEPRVRAVHGPSTQEGSSVWFIRTDPLLAYAMGRNLSVRGYRLRDGVFGESGRLVGFSRPRVVAGGGGGTLPRGDSASCATCHNVPFGELGAGTTIHKDGGAGRNTPHMYGAGLLEMIGQRLRQEVLSACDGDGGGWIGPGEGGRVLVTPAPGAAPLDFGHCEDRDGDGLPDVDGLIRPTYVDARGRWVSWARSLDSEGVAGWSPEVQVFGHGQVEGALTASLRAIFVAAADVHSGLQARDGALLDDPDGDGVAEATPSGMAQHLTIRPRDRGRVLTKEGLSLDDPDRDGFMQELTRGDLDLAEHFMLHIPPPVEVPSPEARRGRRAFEAVGCARCHVPDWRVPEDRRLFRLEPSASASGVVTGRLVRTWREGEGGAVPVGDPFVARGVYSDLRKHDLGPAFHEVGFDGQIIRRFKTSPLWGVGSSGPWGHDGASLTLEAVILRHGGEAAAVTRRYQALGRGERRDLLDFLRSLRLYAITGLPADVDGDGHIASTWEVAGLPTGGPERFDPELLARHPCKMEGPTRALDGGEIFSKACTNVEELYQLERGARRDRDRDGFPDVMDGCPGKRGFLDGCEMPASYTGQ